MNYRALVYQILFLVLMIGVISYVIFHAINGKRGLMAMFEMSEKLDALQAELDEVRAEKLILEHRANLLRSDSLDLDLLDEQARKILGFSKQDEVIYFTNNNTKDKK